MELQTQAEAAVAVAMESEQPAGMADQELLFFAILLGLVANKVKSNYGRRNI
jgi:hypothetical protein